MEPYHQVEILIDASNVYYTAANQTGKKMDYEKLSKAAAAGRTSRTTLYCAFDDSKSEAFDGFVGTIAQKGIMVKAKPIKRFSGGRVKGNCDVEMTIDAMDSKAHVVAIVSGDGDFTPLAERLKDGGRRVEVYCFGAQSARELKAAADLFVDLSGRPDVMMNEVPTIMTRRSFGRR